MTDHSHSRIGLVYTISAFFVWGVLPLYWNYTTYLPSEEISIYRAVSSAFLLFIMLRIQKKFSSVYEAFKRPSAYVIPAILLFSNWWIFVYAISINRVLEASLGYYINPLLSIVASALFLGEKLSRLAKIAFLFAVFGVGYMTYEYGRLPWISLLLAVSFAIYSVMKKKNKTNPTTTLFLETSTMSLLSIPLIFFLPNSPYMISLEVSAFDIMIVLSMGLVTILPLFLFNKGVRLIPLSTVGFIQYLGPTLMFVVGYFIFDETFSRGKLIGFLFIWCSVLIYLYSISRSKNRTKSVAKRT